LNQEPRPLGQRLREFLFGPPKDPRTRGLFHHLSLGAFLAWVGLGSDGLTSSCYGPEEAFLALGQHYHLALFVALAIGVTVFIIAASYAQIVELFPTGGGGYTVATTLLSPTAGMVSGSALLIDYVLTITISIASGADALFSFLPPEWLPWKLLFASAMVSALVLLNLRGVKESVAPLVPIFILFLVTHAVVIIYSLASHAGMMPQVMAESGAAIRQTRLELGTFGMLILLLRAYSLGAGTYTGIEAVSNSMRILHEPKVRTAKRTMRYMALSLALTAMGLMVAYVLFQVQHQPGKTLNATLLESMTAGWGAGGHAFVLVTLLAEAVLLLVAAQTGFLDGSNVLANMGGGRWLPTRFASLSDRYVTQNGVLIMGGAALVTMLATRGSVRFLVVLYSINVFITFTLSQLGMVRHWLAERRAGRRWRGRILVSGAGLTLTSLILVLVVVLKFHEGGWITLLITGSLVALAALIRRHYRKVEAMLARLDGLVEAVELEPARKEPAEAPAFRQDGKTAVFLVSGFNGLGLHTLFTALRTFRGVFHNFIFLEVGIIDTSVFKGEEEIAALEQRIQADLDHYVRYMHRHGFHARGIPLLGTDIPREVQKVAADLSRQLPGAIFFGGQIVFPHETVFSGWLHNYTVFAIQKRLYYQGVPVFVLPIRLEA
jgi:amino acid transporter